MSTHSERVDEEFDSGRFMEDLTLLLIHLSSWRERASADLGVVRSWKGYDFGVVDRLKEERYIYGSNSAKSVTLTEEGIREAERLKETFLRAMGNTYRHDVARSSARSNARAEVEFFCDTCQSLIQAPSGYEPFERYCEGKISRERIMELLHRYHTRHWHTDAQRLSRDRLAYNLRNGMEFEEAAAEAKDYARKMVNEGGHFAENDTAGPKGK